MPRISDDAVSEVRRASDLVDVVGDRVRLKKQGRRFMGLCPFHNEKSPSFSVDPAEGLYYCFGCRKGGDVFKFVQETEGVGFLDAVRLLADKAGIELDEGPADPNADRKAAMSAALRFAGRFYFQQLGTDAGARGLAYLKERGFSPETVKTFGIGVAPAGWDGLVRAATEAGHAPEILEAVGLAKQRTSGGHYDAFRDRLMFPILSPIGKVLGFGGRILPDTQTGSDDYSPAKYINSPDTEVYNKSRELYGLKQAKRAIRAEEEAIIVEGYADVVSLYQAGIQNVVAASGTSLTVPQIALLAKTARTLVLLFDADAAGQSAARKAIDTALDGGLVPYAVALPDGADPDSYVRQFGADAFRTRLRDERLDFVTFLARRARADGDLATPEGKAAAVRETAEALARVSDLLVRGEYVRAAADAFDVDEVTLRREVEAAAKRPRRRDRPPRPPAPPSSAPPSSAPPSSAPPAEDVVGYAEPSPYDSPPEAFGDAGQAPEQRAAAPAAAPPAQPKPEEGALLRLMLREGYAMVEHVMTRIGLEMFTDGPPRQLAAALLEQYADGDIDRAPFVRGDHGEALQALVLGLLPERYVPSERAESKGLKPVERDQEPFAVARSSIRLLQIDRIEEAEDEINRQVRRAEAAGDDVSGLMREKMDLTDLKRRIERGDSPIDA